MILQPKVTVLGPLRFALWLEPLTLSRNIRTLGIKAGDSFAVEIHEHVIAGKRDYDRFPLTTRLVRNRVRSGERINRAGSVKLIVRVHDLNLIAPVHSKPRP